MAATVKENIPPTNNSKSSKKKGAKAEASSPGSGPSQVPGECRDELVNGEMNSESIYLKEINKNIRNLKKKIAASSKVETILAENNGKSAAELLASRVINADQKAQLDKKPSLVAQLEQNEFQYEQYKKLDDEYKHKFSSEKESLIALHKEELGKVKATVRAEVEEEQKIAFTEKLLTLSRFLRTAAAKRSDEDHQSEDNGAFEGALLLVYGGDFSAVQAIEKLIDGAEENIPGVEGEETHFSFKHVRDESLKEIAVPQFNDAIEQSAETPPAKETSSDPTILNAGLTELEDFAITTNGETTVNESGPVTDVASIDSGAANEVAEAHWDLKLTQSIVSGPDGFEMIDHPSNAAVHQNGVNPATAPATGTSSWAEDVPTDVPVIPSATPADDGFHEVSHHRAARGRGSHGGQGEWRGSRGGRGRGDGRGRSGSRGDGRGRGRGGPHRGDRGRGRGEPAN